MYKDSTGSVYKENDRFISNNNYYEIDKDMSADSVEKRALFEKVVIDGRKKMLNETLINSDSECSGNW